jgi:hypothetical protein
MSRRKKSDHGVYVWAICSPCFQTQQALYYPLKNGAIRVKLRCPSCGEPMRVVAMFKPNAYTPANRTTTRAAQVSPPE